MGLRNDYRVSTIVVLCKDCDQDVGLYPARHKCNSSNKLPQLPTLCSSTTSFSSWNSRHDEQDVPDLVDSNPTSTTVTRQASDSSMESGKWSFFRSSSTSDVKKHANDEQERPADDEGESVYFDTYASHLKNSSSLTDLSNISSPNGKKLWGKMKENEKWKELIAEKKEESNKSGKLWERIIHATMSNSVEEDGPESDDDDWEGETHVSRILREYHQNSSTKSLPPWLYDDRTPISTLASVPSTEHHVIQEQIMNRKNSSRTRRLWQPAETQQLSSRERELQTLRAENQTPEESYYKKPSILRSQSERMPSQASSLRNTHHFQHPNMTAGAEPDQIYGSTTPRRMNTTRLPPSSLYQHQSKHNYIPPSTPPRPVRSNTFF
ncbi:hypothetical protein V8B55DRAFT_1492004 [Mucor lusitanicus]|uniref:Mso1 N-terminal domain-containing protein n=2 Tax=Mucor circinelloides f. lusitanicus TaxID=29924 RepID=A0A162THX1_MUCCL|nr:hypothetical protein FB192DRAFT_1362593 [Mucor lusitanicus]OAD04712.1 hypothetical protein MUCCIDRAFT_155687 [Mucor lusitanicus CBS 277.49]